MTIKGGTVASPTPKSDWNQNDPTKADYIKNKPDPLLRSGGTMAGPINMGGNVIWGLGNPTGYDQAIPYRMFLDELAKKANLINCGDYTGNLDTTGNGGVPYNSIVWVTPSNSPDGNWGWVETLLSNDDDGRCIQRYTSTNANIYVRSRYDNGTGMYWHCNWTRVDAQNRVSKFSLLWQNASPNSLFAAQTISVDLSAYDTVLITYNQYYENNNVAMCFVPKFCYGQLETVMTGGRYRTLFVGNEGVTFENQLMADGSAGSNNYCIPSQIFGCKLA